MIVGAPNQPEAGAIGGATYRVSWWDHEAARFVTEWSGLTLGGMRRAYRELLGRGFDPDVSILVEREPDA